MGRALAQARRASGRTWPNPAVGAVVYRGSRLLGTGHTRPAGGSHAEVVAIASVRRRHGESALRGASLAVTLEPCSHQGRTGPCTEAILAAGIARVDVGHRDPGPHVAGRGIRRLRARGVEVRLGVLEERCRAQHRGYLSVVERSRPWLILKLAATLDGRIATARGESRWISGERSRERVHALRAASDAVLVGSGTVRADDPELSARRGDRIVHRPVRVVVDSALGLPRRSKLLRNASEYPTWVLCAPRAPRDRRVAFERMGARVLSIRRRGRQLDLDEALRRLAEEGLTRVLVEGGGQLAAALLRRQLVDEVHWFVAPTLLGDDGRPALGELGIGRLAERVRLEGVTVSRLGDDVYVQGLVREATESA